MSSMFESRSMKWRHAMYMATVEVFWSSIVRGGFHIDLGFFSGMRGVSDEVSKRVENTAPPGPYYLAHQELQGTIDLTAM